MNGQTIIADRRLLKKKCLSPKMSALSIAEKILFQEKYRHSTDVDILYLFKMKVI